LSNNNIYWKLFNANVQRDKTMIKEIIQWITPPETEGIVNELFNGANEIRDINNSVKNSKDQLLISWQGGQTREEILDTINENIDSLERMASELESKARKIAMITVMTIIIEHIEDTFGIND
jgi:uncharacterized protein YukE